VSYPRKEEAAFVRLHALVRKGYRADLGATVDPRIIRLKHPRGASAGAPSLLLCPDGRLIGTDNVRPLNDRHHDPDCIYVDSEVDDRLFQKFVNSIPAPTIFQTLISTTIWEAKMQIVIVLISVGIVGGLVFFGWWMLHFVVSR
jgi:hypothetical protein